MLHNHAFDFYCFNETNIHEKCTDDFEIDGYSYEMAYAIENKAKG